MSQPPAAARLLRRNDDLASRDCRAKIWSLHIQRQSAFLIPSNLKPKLCHTYFCSAQIALLWTLFETGSSSVRSGAILSQYIYLCTHSNSTVGFVQGITGIAQVAAVSLHNMLVWSADCGPCTILHGTGSKATLLNTHKHAIMLNRALSNWCCYADACSPTGWLAC